MAGLSIAEMKSILIGDDVIEKGPVDDVSVCGGVEDPLSQDQFFEALAMGVPVGLAKSVSRVTLPAPNNHAVRVPEEYFDEPALTSEQFFRCLAAGLPFDAPPVKKMLTPGQEVEMEELEKKLFSDMPTLLAKLRTAAFKKGKINVVKLVTRMIREVEETA